MKIESNISQKIKENMLAFSKVKSQTFYPKLRIHMMTFYLLAKKIRKH